MMSIDDGYRRIYEGVSGGYVDLHQQADPRELDENIAISMDMVDKLEDRIRIRPHSYTEGVTNPEVEINGRIGDLKKPDYSQYKNVWRPISRLAQTAVKQQGGTHVVITLVQNYTLPDVIEGVRHGFRNAHTAIQTLEVMDIRFRNEGIIRIYREEYEDGTYQRRLTDGWLPPA